MKYLRARCGEQVILFNLNHVIEVVDAVELSTSNKVDHSKTQAVDENVIIKSQYKKCFKKIIWRDFQIESIALPVLINADKKNTSNKYIVIAEQQHITLGLFEQSIAIGVSEIEDILEATDEDEVMMYFKNPLLSRLMNKTIFNESNQLIEYVLNIPINVGELKSDMSNGVV